MSTPARKPALDPLISRQYEPSRLQHTSLRSAYVLIIPAVSRRLGPSARRRSEPGSARARGGDLRHSAGGA